MPHIDVVVSLQKIFLLENICMQNKQMIIYTITHIYLYTYIWDCTFFAWVCMKDRERDRQTDRQ